MDGARAEVTAMQRTARGLLGQGWPCKARDGSGRAGVVVLASALSHQTFSD